MQFSFRPVTQDDISLLEEWFARPHVMQWWPTPREHNALVSYITERIHARDRSLFMVLHDDISFGYAQYYHITEDQRLWLPQLPDDAVGIDQFIADEENLGKGYGTQLVKQFVDIICSQNFSTIILDVESHNKRAIRCYEKVGFGHLGRYAAPWGDVLVMRYSCVDKG